MEFEFFFCDIHYTRVHKIDLFGNKKLTQDKLLLLLAIKLDKIHIAQPLIAYPSTIHEKYLGYRKTWELSAFESYLKSQAKIKVNENIVNKI